MPREMSSSFSSTTLPLPDIVAVLSQWEIANIRVESLANPTSEFVCSLYHALLSHIDPLMDDPGQADFEGLDLLENLDVHTYSVRMVNLWLKMKDLISSTCSMNFTMKDLVCPKRDRTVKFISAIVNFLFYRDDKLNILRPIVENTNNLEVRQLEVEAKRSELSKDIADHEDLSRMEQPMVEELQTEVNELHQTIQSLNKQQRSIRSSFQKLQDDTKEIDVKISSADLKLVEAAQVNSKLHSSIVQSPDKLQGALEEKKSIRSEVLSLERLAMQVTNEKKSKIEVYIEAAKKLSKHVEKMQALQERINSAKNLDKEVKILKAKLAEEGMFDMSLEAKIVEREGRAKKACDLEKAAEKERNLKHREAVKELNNLKLECEAKLHDLDLRDKKMQALILEADSIKLKIEAVNNSGLLTQHKLYSKFEEILQEFDNYISSLNPVLSRLQQGLE